MTSWVCKISAFLGKTVFPWQVKKVLLSGVFGLFQAAALSMVLNVKFGWLASISPFVFWQVAEVEAKHRPNLIESKDLDSWKLVILVNISKTPHTLKRANYQHCCARIDLAMLAFHLATCAIQGAGFKNPQDIQVKIKSRMSNMKKSVF